MYKIGDIVQVNLKGVKNIFDLTLAKKINIKGYVIMKKILIVAICMLLTTGCSGSKESVKEENTTQEKTQALVEKNKLKEELKKELKQEQEENKDKQEQQEQTTEINSSHKVDARPKDESLHGSVSEETKQQWYDKLYEASHTDDFDGAYDKADYVLNEAWKAIKENSNNYTYKQLLAKQKEWIANKESMSFYDQVNETINRCYYLIDTYL